MAIKASASTTPSDEGKLLSLLNIAESAARMADIFALLQDAKCVQRIRDCADVARAGYELTQEEKTERDQAVAYLADAERVKTEIAEAETRLAQDQAASLKVIADAKKEADSDIELRIAAVSAREEAISAREKAADDKVTAANEKVAQNETAHADCVREIENRERAVSEREAAVAVREKNAEDNDKSLTEWEESLTKTYNKISGAIDEIKS